MNPHNDQTCPPPHLPPTGRVAAWMLAATVMATAAACGGDLTASIGERGRVVYALHTDYEVPAGTLTDATLVTDHTQRIDVALTSEGHDVVNRPGDLRHEMSPSAGVTVETVGDNLAGFANDVRIRVTQPGRYTLTTFEGARVIDFVQVTFDKPVTFEMVTWVREPNGPTFGERFGSVIDVTEGSQASFVWIPRAGDGTRLAGDMEVEMTVTDPGLAVEGQNVNWTFEKEGVQWIEGPPSVYFIEPGVVDVVLTDPISAATGAQTFEVHASSP